MSARRSFVAALVALVVSLPLVNAAAKHAAETASLPKTRVVGVFNAITLTDAQSSCERTKRLAVRENGQAGCWLRDSESTVSIVWATPTTSGTTFKPRRYQRSLFMKKVELMQTKPASAVFVAS